MSDQIHQGIGTSAYGKYNIEVIKSGGNESYFPFGTGYQNNVVLDDFFIKIFSGYELSVQAFMQTCITNTGSLPATRFDTTGTFGVPNDVTWASNFFGRNVIPSEGRIVLARDFTFDVVTGAPRTYREAMVGLFYKDRSNVSARISSDIAVSHFVFPENITLNIGERLRVNYIFNIILDYLKTSNKPQIQLTGNGYNFGGTLGIMTSNVGLGLENPPGNQTTSIFDERYAGIQAFPGPCYLYKDINLNQNSYIVSCTNSSSSTIENHLFGPRLIYRPVFYGSGGAFVPQEYPNRYPGATNIPWASNSFAVPIANNLVVNENGGYMDVDYFFSPHTGNINASGIILTRGPQEINYPGHVYAGIYLQFNTGQFIPATMPLSMKLRWFWNR